MDKALISFSLTLKPAMDNRKVLNRSTDKDYCLLLSSNHGVKIVLLGVRDNVPYLHSVA